MKEYAHQQWTRKCAVMYFYSYSRVQGYIRTNAMVSNRKTIHALPSVAHLVIPRLSHSRDARRRYRRQPPDTLCTNFGVVRSFRTSSNNSIAELTRHRKPGSLRRECGLRDHNNYNLQHYLKIVYIKRSFYRVSPCPIQLQRFNQRSSALPQNTYDVIDTEPGCAARRGLFAFQVPAESGI